MWKLLAFFVVLANALAQDTVPSLPSEETLENRASLEYVRQRAHGTYQAEKDDIPVAESKSTNGKDDPSEYLLEDDMVLTPQQADSLLSHRHKRQIKRYPWMKWSTSEPIPYIFSENYDNETRTLIKKALQFWQDHTCLSFREANGFPVQHFVRFTITDGCWSDAGMDVRPSDSPDHPPQNWQDVSIGRLCQTFGIIAHEIGHVLGFVHAQSRTDRDQFVKINYNLMGKEEIFQYHVEGPALVSSYFMPYDYGSIMHYPEGISHMDRKSILMTAVDPRYQQTMGQRIKPSFQDVLMVNTHYQCLDHCKNSGTVCHRGGYPNPKDCTKCICPWGFFGTNCWDRDIGKNESKPCGLFLRATAEPQLLDITMGQDGSPWTGQHDECHWHIMAPNDTQRVEIKVENFGNDCSPGCENTNIELKMGKDMTKSGFRMCCNERPHNVAQTTMTSETDLAVLSAYAMNFDQFSVTYRYVDATDKD